MTYYEISVGEICVFSIKNRFIIYSRRLYHNTTAKNVFIDSNRWLIVEYANLVVVEFNSEYYDVARIMECCEDLSH